MAGLGPLAGALLAGGGFALGGQALREGQSRRRGSRVAEAIGEAPVAAVPGRPPLQGQAPVAATPGQAGSGFLGAGGFENPGAVARLAADFTGIEGMTEIGGQLLAGSQTGTRQQQLQKTRLAQQWDEHTQDLQQRTAFNERATTLREQGLDQDAARNQAALEIDQQTLAHRREAHAQDVALRERALTTKTETAQNRWVEGPGGTRTLVPKPGTPRYQKGQAVMQSREQALSKIIELKQLFDKHGTEIGSFGIMDDTVSGRMGILYGDILAQIASVERNGGVLSPGELEVIQGQFANPSELSLFTTNDQMRGQMGQIIANMTQSYAQDAQNYALWGLSPKQHLLRGGLVDTSGTVPMRGQDEGNRILGNDPRDAPNVSPADVSGAAPGAPVRRATQTGGVRG